MKEKEPDDGQDRKYTIFASIQRNLYDKDFEYLKNRYQLERDDIRHISQTTFTLRLRNREIYEQALRTGSIQMGPELIFVSEPKDRDSRHAKIVQCFLCQAYGHFRSWCPTIAAHPPNGKPTCRYCSRKHESKDCQHSNDPRYHRCANCDPQSNRHKAGSKECPKFREELEKAQSKLRNHTNEDSPTI
jgi:hypothetical protein